MHKRLTTVGLMQKLGIRARETVRQRSRNDPSFPRPVRDPGSHVNYYLEEEVDAWIQRLADGRDGNAKEPPTSVRRAA
jgi:predicted DNA-binding transcriptional regulator AlpA